MGYTTEFNGVFTLNKPLDEETKVYLENFASTRRMKRDPKVLEQMGFGPAETFGIDGEFFVNEDDLLNYGQKRDESIVDYNSPPRTQPGLWCQWVPTEDGTGIEWDGNEKFYHAIEWIEYVIDFILAPKGYVLNGGVDARGEEFGDLWHIVIRDNVVDTGAGYYGEVINASSDKWDQLTDFISKLKDYNERIGEPEALYVIKEIQNKMNELN